MDKKTPLFNMHVEAGGRMTPFAGYILPIQYEGVIAEHMAVRTKAGLFDVSHMAELVISGPDAMKNVNMLVTSDISDMCDGQIKYGLMCNEQGGIVDDILVYRLSEDKYLLVVNAGNQDKDEKWVNSHLFGNVKMDNVSESTAQMALQGPLAESILSKICDINTFPKKHYTFSVNCEIITKEGIIKALISRTGYTGEDGFEIYCDSDKGEIVWKTLLENGKSEGLVLCGLGARDTLRLEASMPLYGHELSETITPIEAGLKLFVNFEKDDFYGKSAIVTKGFPKVKRVGLKITGKGIAREQNLIFINGNQVGHVTSGTFCPFIGYAAAMAYIPTQDAILGNKVEIDVRGRLIEAEIVRLRFYRREK